MTTCWMGKVQQVGEFLRYRLVSRAPGAYALLWPQPVAAPSLRTASGPLLSPSLQPAVAHRVQMATRPLMRACTHTCIHSFHSSTPAFTRSLIHSLMHAFIHKCMPSFIDSIHSLIILSLPDARIQQPRCPSLHHSLIDFQLLSPAHTRRARLHAPFLPSLSVLSVRSRFQRGLCPGSAPALGPAREATANVYFGAGRLKVRCPSGDAADSWIGRGGVGGPGRGEDARRPLPPPGSPSGAPGAGHEAAPAWRGAAAVAWTSARGGRAGAGAGFRSAAQPAGPRRWGAGDAWWAQGRGAGPGRGCRSAAGAGAQGPGGAEAAWARRGLGAAAARARGEERGGAQGCGRPGGGGGAGARRKLRGRSGGAGPGEGCGGAWALGGPGGARAARALRKGAGGGRSGGRGAKSILRGEGRRASLGHRLPGARRGLWGHPGGQGPGDDGGVGRGSPGAQRECGETGGEGLTRGRGCRAVLQPRGSVWNAELSPQARSSARVAWRRHLRQARLEAAPAPRRTWPPSAHGALGLRPCRVSREDPSCSAPLLSWRGSDWPALGARKVVPNPLAPTVRLPSVPRGWRAWCPWGRWRWGSQQLGGGRGLVWSGGAEVW